MFTVNPRFTQALAWQLVRNGDVIFVGKNGGLSNTSTYIGMIPGKRLGMVILSNCGGEPATRIGRQIMLALARSNAVVSDDGRQGIEFHPHASPAGLTRGPIIFVRSFCEVDGLPGQARQ